MKPSDEPTLEATGFTGAAFTAPLLAESVSADPSEDTLPPGTMVGEYVIERFVGRGTFGAVYAARRYQPPGLAAIKVMHAAVSSWPKAVERFVREVSVVRLLRHPGIAEIYDLGKLDDGRPYYAMEYLHGEPLAALLARQGRLSVDEAIDILEPVCETLEAAHQAGIVHRDIKASNIIVTGEGKDRRVKLLDFGVAKLLDDPNPASGFTTIGRVVGTLSAAAPEQILGGDVDARTDVYALGILLFRLLTGQHPFWSPDEVELAWRHIEEPPPRPSTLAPVSPLVDSVVLRSLEKNAELRFPSAQAFFVELCEAAGGSRSQTLAGAMAATAAGIHVDLEIDDAADDLDAAQLADIGRTLDLAEETLRQEGFVVALATGRAVLAVRPLPGDQDEAAGRRAAEGVATSLSQALAARAGADARVRPRVRMHVEQALLRRTGTPELVGGPLAELGAWPAASEIL